jgi:diguanylate cyclase
MVAGDDSGPLTLALCDIDNFKAINDGHGHETGDRVLRFVAQLLREQLDRRAFVARYGGEEFVCLFQGVGVDAAVAALDAARIALSHRSLRDQSSGAAIGAITFSAGVAAADGDATAALREADSLLYAAKRQGKDQILARAA